MPNIKAPAKEIEKQNISQTQSETLDTVDEGPVGQDISGNLESQVSKLQRIPDTLARRTILRLIQARSGNNYTGKVAKAYQQVQRQFNDPVNHPITPSKVQRTLTLDKATFLQDVQDHYSPEWFGTFKGADSHTKTHMTTVDGVDGNRIKGCHDEATFKAAIIANNGILRSSTAVSTGITELGYSLPTKAGDMRTAVAKKTVIKDLTSGYDAWEKKADEAALAAITAKTLAKTGISEGTDKAGKKFQLIIDGSKPGFLATFFPLT